MKKPENWVAAMLVLLIVGGMYAVTVYQWLTEASKTYPVNPEYLLIMHSDRTYPNIKLIDYGLRAVATALVPIFLLSGCVLVPRLKKKVLIKR